MKKKSLVMMLASLSLVGTIMVGATFAYFTDTTAAVTNTFTVGDNVAIELLENLTQDSLEIGKRHIVGYPDTGNMIVEANDQSVEFKEIYPSLVLNKAPFVRKPADTSDCYVRVTLAGVDTLINNGFEVTINENWIPINHGDVDKNNKIDIDGIYQYNSKLKGDSDVDTIPIFKTVTFRKDNLNLSSSGASLGGITIKGYAIQADGFESAYEAFKTVDEGDTSKSQIAAVLTGVAN